ncbi:unnamed protein product [Chondrus crispus]|uniref:Uncharacterized protein n=1 Tax=Chondrus crispus TaxID=2769 RepID=R7Q899_CHOCR|nr:unnamed protein product [Chondrus crispus]CDF34264.1 unnamed protein product [Chondrus crispus]|eukprot:XP_005714083.1 unnamed protein product [Chondrus crispus]
MLAKLWSSNVAYRAGSRVSSGSPVQLRPRPYTRSSLVTEEDGNDWRFRLVIAFVAFILLSADLLIEFGSGSSDVASGNMIATGYGAAGRSQPLDVRRNSDGTWSPALRSQRIVNATYQVYEVDLVPDEAWGITERDIQVIKSTRSAVEVEGRVISSAIPDQWMLTGNGRELWFSGRAGAALVKDDKLLITTGLASFVLLETSWTGEASIAVTEIVSNLLFVTYLQICSDYNITVTVRMDKLPQLMLDCDGNTEYPASWQVVCVDVSIRPSEVVRHDGNLLPPALTTLKSQSIKIDYGKRVEMKIPWAIFDEVDSRPSSSPDRSIRTETFNGENATLVVTETGGMLMMREGRQVTCCLSVIGDMDNKGLPACRMQDGRSENEADAMFKALQLASADYNKIWRIYHSWIKGDEERSQTEVNWISTELQTELGSLISDVKTVATINIFFIIGVGIILVTFLVGASVHVFYRLKLVKVEPSCRRITLETSRRVLAMSASCKYNCGMVPGAPPRTSVVRSGDKTCHLDTSYSLQDDSISATEAAKEGLVLVGRRVRARDGEEAQSEGSLPHSCAVGRVAAAYRSRGRGRRNDEHRIAWVKSPGRSKTLLALVRKDGRMRPLERL